MTEEVNPMHEQDAPAPQEFFVEEHHEEVAVEHVAEAPVVEEVVYVEPTPEVVEEPVAKSKNEERAPQAASKRGSKNKVVHTSALVFKSNSRNSVSVGLVQERLMELGFVDAGADKYGWLCEGTMKALADFAKTTVAKCNPQDASMVEALFAGTKVEVINCK
jgi:hypothetical protein